MEYNPLYVYTKIGNQTPRIYTFNDQRTFSIAAVISFPIYKRKVLFQMGTKLQDSAIQDTLHERETNVYAGSFLLTLASYFVFALNSFCLLEIILYYVRLDIITMANMKMAVFLVVVPRSLVEVYRRFRAPCCIQTISHRPHDAATKQL
jgi:hypothetical protein